MHGDIGERLAMKRKLRKSDGKVPVIAQRKHDDIINGHVEHLAKSAEAMRRELMPLAILASNYVDEARKAHANLQQMLEWTNKRNKYHPGKPGFKMFNSIIRFEYSI